MQEILQLGDMYVSDFIKSGQDYSDRKKYPVNLVLDENIGAAHLTEQPPADMMWGKNGYWYRSSINGEMLTQLKNLVDDVISKVKHKNGDIWLDIATNDGGLFKFVPNTYKKVGIDPADDTFYAESSKVAEVIQDYFSADAYRRTSVGDKKAQVITTVAMFYDLQRPGSFVEDIKQILDDNGVWVIQLSYTPLMIRQVAFDNILGEHYYYYSLNSIKKLMEKHGMEVVDSSLNDTNGGSCRVFLQKKGATFATQQIRDCAEIRVQSLLDWEDRYCDISDPKVWEDFQTKIEELKEKTVAFIKKAKEEGKTVAAIGASTKGNTLLQYFGLDNTLIDFISERSPAKFGLTTIGTNIPILSEEESRARKPDYMLMLPWHFVSEIVAREQEYLKNGGKFIVPCPKFEIIG